MSNQENLQVTDISRWKKGGNSKVVPLPSGMVARLKVVGMEAFVTSGAIPNSLMKLVVEQLDEAKKGKEVDIDPQTFIKELQDDPQKLTDLVELVDRVALKSFVEPKLYPVPADEDERRDDRLYVDEVDGEDKFFVFNFASSGTSELEPFREAIASGVENAPDEQVVEGTP